jgi:hypothetical protein
MNLRSYCLSAIIGWLFTFVATTNANAGVITVGNVDWTGSRSQLAGEITADGSAWGAALHDFTISYEVSLSGGLYTYSYSFNYNRNDGGGLSHVVIATSDGLNGTTAFTDDNVFAGTTGFSPPDNDFIVGDQTQEDDFGAPSEPYGIKFEIGDDILTSAKYQLVTDRSPIWGSFFAKGGGNPKNFAYNVGWSNTGYYLALDSSNFNKMDWIPIPDSATAVVPEPASLAMFGTFAIGSVFLRRRRA